MFCIKPFYFLFFFTYKKATYVYSKTYSILTYKDILRVWTIICELPKSTIFLTYSRLATLACANILYALHLLLKK